MFIDNSEGDFHPINIIQTFKIFKFLVEVKILMKRGKEKQG